MKKTINGLRYDSANCERLAERDHYSNGNYSGSSTLLLAKNGKYLIHTYSNGQDFYLQDAMYICEDPTEWLDGVDLTDEQEKRCVELSLIELV